MWAPLAPPSQEWMAKQINQGRHPPALDEMIDMPIELWRAAYKAFRPHKNWKAWLAEDGHDIHRACFEIREFSGVKWFSPFPHPDQMDSPLDQLCSARRTSAELRIVIRDMRRIGKFSWQPGANDDPMDEDATAADADNNNAAAAALQTPAVAPTSVEVTPIPDQPAMHKMLAEAATRFSHPMAPSHVAAAQLGTFTWVRLPTRSSVMRTQAPTRYGEGRLFSAL